MNKSIVILIAAIVCLIGCKDHEDYAYTQGVDQVETAKVSFTFYDKSMVPISGDIRATRADDETTVSLKSSTNFKRLDFILIPDNAALTAPYVVSQQITDEDFGTIDGSFLYGTYKMVVIAHRSTDKLDLSNPSSIEFPDGKVTDMLYCYKEITIDKATVAQDVALQRACSMFNLCIKDAKPENLSSFSFEFSGACGYFFNATTGLAAKAIETEVNISTETIEVGSVGFNFKVYTFLTSEAANINVTATALDTNGGTINSVAFTDVAMRMNYKTVYSGNFFTNTNDWTISIPSSYSTWEQNGDTVEF